MQNQQKEDRKPIGKILQERGGASSFEAKEIRPSRKFTFYGVTFPNTGYPETSLAFKILKASGEQFIIQFHELISPMHFDGATKIVLLTTTMSIKITGENLGDLIDYLAEHRLMWIKEPDSDHMEVEKGEVYIENIKVEEK